MVANKVMLESDINDKIAELFKDDFWTIQKSRISPAEFDIVLLDSKSLTLINIEIKRNNWRNLIEQAVRGLVYCHYSIAALPVHIKNKIPLDEIEKLGVGVLFYEIENENLTFVLELKPKMSKMINRSCKKIMYNLFVNKYGSQLYA